MLTYGPEFKASDLWTKRIGPSHIAGSSNQTLCGLPMLGNNYSKYVDLNNCSICTECLKLYHSKN